MLTINLRRADGKELPYHLQVRSAGLNDYLEFAVVDIQSGEVLSCETFHRDLIPLSRYHPDLQGNAMVMGNQHEYDVMLIEFGGEDARLGMAGLGEVRSAVNVASIAGQDLIAA